MSERERTGRFEYKYAVPVAAREQILELALAHVVPDPHASPLPEGASGYHVHSLYFDTPDLLDYYERLDGLKVRNRLRVRTYNTPDEDRPVFLENKRKLYDRVVKHRVRICKSREWLKEPGGTPWVRFCEPLKGQKRYAARSFRELVERGGRVPVSCVHYRREVYVDSTPGSQVRLTLDRDITAASHPEVHDLFATPNINLLPPDWMVLELKFGGDRPGWMRRIIRELGLRATPVSKFGLSVALGRRTDRPAEVRFFTPRPLRSARPARTLQRTAG